MSVICFQVQVSATGRTLVQRSPAECGVSERNLKTSTGITSRPTRAAEPYKNVRQRYLDHDTNTSQCKACFLDICKVISQQVFAFCCVEVVNMLSVMQEVNHTRRHLVRISAFCCVDVVNMLSVMQEVNNMRRHLVRISAERKETPLPLKRRDQLYDQTRKWRSLSRHFRKDKLSCTCWKLNQDYSLDHHVSSSAYPESYFRI